MLHDQDDSALRQHANINLRWRVLRLLNLFRVGIGLVFLAGLLFQPEGGMLGSVQPRLFLFTTITVLVVAGLAALSLARRWPSARIQALTLLSADSALFLLVLQSSGGLETGLGNLLFIPVAAASLLLGQRLAISLAAVVTLALLFQQVLIAWSLPQIPARFTHAGILSALFMFISLGGAHLARRLRESEALALRRGLDLRNLSELNDYIIHHLRTGIVVVDHQDRLQLINGAAAQFLGIDPEQRGRPVQQVSQQLDRLVRARRSKPFERPASFTAADGETVVVPRFTELGAPENPGTLIFLEDSNLQGQRAQEMKLAALGRFTASIAHELRNPLSAINHANQLLAESERLGAEEQHLNGIIDRHAQRVNRIIETVLKLSRREATEPKQLNLSEWLADYSQHLEDAGTLKPEEINCQHPEGSTRVRMDDDHLVQVVDNLVNNALRYGEPDGREKVTLRIAHVGRGNRPCLEVINRGPGIPDEDAVNIFEPFYTASPRGTGLGLFVARELCDCNRARLEYRYQNGNNVFRIVFSDPDRWLS
ncbi:two-component system sensor histidine kinase PilS (NtrC family) [Natronospira proteinivora]|uniref:histidine kinase n=1 Tax=Natronospira proteinivora TaxID=1807133 RepID=A0ABT1G854_9GAMM|nr:ATP-binding protein [Natronospira proteinivora]MCP1727491.1 two-component system sensor histidine kinase PilS (NtrC family) [Natronospira proteinivora]